MPRNYQRRQAKDAALIRTIALADDAAVITPALDLIQGENNYPAIGDPENPTKLDRLPSTYEAGNFEVEVAVPALTTAQLPDDATVLAELFAPEDPNDDEELGDALGNFTVTGADAAGAAARSERFRIGPAPERYLRARFTTTGTGAGVTTASGELAIVI